MAYQQGNDGGLRELALFAGAGGGILGGHLLGWRTVCAVEWEPYPASVLCARQNDGLLAPFPIWDDVRTFDGRPWRGIVGVVSGGFPCQDISSAGRGAGIDGERSGMWREMARIVGEVRPRFVFVENSPMLTSRGLGRVLGDLAALGYDSEWDCISAADCGAPHKRDRIWLLACDPNSNGQPNGPKHDEASRVSEHVVPYSASVRQQGQGEPVKPVGTTQDGDRQAGKPWAVSQHREWPVEPNVGRVANGVAARVDRLKVTGNGQVPRVAAYAFASLRARAGW